MKLASKKREQAALLLAEDRYPDSKIAELCGISERALGKWKNRPEFSSRVRELTSIYAERVLKFGLARRERRLAVLSSMHERILRLIDERSTDPELTSIPGGQTGLIVKRVKGIRVGEGLQILLQYEADMSLIRELRAIEEQIARELGQWRDRHELTGSNGARIDTDIVERLMQGRARLAARRVADLATTL